MHMHPGNSYEVPFLDTMFRYNHISKTCHDGYINICMKLYVYICAHVMIQSCVLTNAFV